MTDGCVWIDSVTIVAVDAKQSCWVDPHLTALGVSGMCIPPTKCLPRPSLRHHQTGQTGRRCCRELKVLHSTTVGAEINRSPGGSRVGFCYCFRSRLWSCCCVVAFLQPLILSWCVSSWRHSLSTLWTTSVGCRHGLKNSSKEAARTDDGK